MKIARGTKGARRFLATSTQRGWHLFIDDQYVAFTDVTVAEVSARYPGHTLSHWTGNGIHLTTGAAA